MKKDPTVLDLSDPLGTDDWRGIALAFARVLWLALPARADDFAQCMTDMHWARCAERFKGADEPHPLTKDARLDALVVARFLDAEELEHVRERLAYEWHQSPDAAS